ncbi:hypothetical protein BGZ75_010310 [Mortierella antarctica]|nr:hypothetical protein BGZ75_010310 [Mortierella antarctica]
MTQVKMKAQFAIFLFATLLSLVSAAPSNVCNDGAVNCGPGCKDGAMKCGSGGGFDTCDHGRWVHRACGEGTSCRDVKGHIFCDYKTGGGGGSTCKDGAMKCGSGGGFDTCDHGRWVHRACGKGTSCRDVKGHIFCDYK